MSATRILALSSSRVGNSAYLESAVSPIRNLIGTTALHIAFIPFASVDSYEAYLFQVKEGFQDLPYKLSLVKRNNASEIIEKSDVIMVGGGNTFKLLHDLYFYNLVDVICRKVNSGTPYIGWSAGANITGKTIGTTNDMPIIEPKSFRALNFFPFQINPHYNNEKREDHHGETRDQRIEEFLKLNLRIPVVGLPEGTALLHQYGTLKFIGNSTGVIFQNDEHNHARRSELKIEEDLTYLLDQK